MLRLLGHVHVHVHTHAMHGWLAVDVLQLDSALNRVCVVCLAVVWLVKPWLLFMACICGTINLLLYEAHPAPLLACRVARWQACPDGVLL
jgi:hypothetical protein